MTDLADVRAQRELQLCAACAQGDVEAIKRLDAEYLAKVPLYLRHMRLSTTQRDDVVQQVRERLLMGAEPRIKMFSGRGKLDAFIRVVSTRVALNMIAAQPKGVSLAPEDAQLATVAHPEMLVWKRRDRARVEDALVKALASLDEHERLLLKQYWIDGLPVLAIAKIHGTHRVTTAKQVHELSDKLRRAVVLAISRELALPSEEVLQLVKSLLSQVSYDLGAALWSKDI